MSNLNKKIEAALKIEKAIREFYKYDEFQPLPAHLLELIEDILLSLEEQ